MKIEVKLAEEISRNLEDIFDDGFGTALDGIEALLNKLNEYRSKEILSEEFDLTWMLDDFISKIEALKNNLTDFLDDQEDLDGCLQSLLYNYKQAYQMNKMATYAVPINQKFGYMDNKKKDKNNDYKFNPKPNKT